MANQRAPNPLQVLLTPLALPLAPLAGIAQALGGALADAIVDPIATPLQEVRARLQNLGEPAQG